MKHVRSRAASRGHFGLQIVLSCLVAFGLGACSRCQEGVAARLNEERSRAGAPQGKKYAHVEVTGAASAGGAGASAAPGELTMALRVVPDQGFEVSFDNAPWELTITASQGIEFAHAKLGAADVDRKLPGYHAVAMPAPAAANVDTERSFSYSLIAFICTETKTHCYREVHTGRHVLATQVPGKG